MNPKFAFITLGWNSAEYIKRCFDSIYAQSSKDFITIFVDNDSKDNTLNIIKDNYPEVIVLPQSTNTGFACANNIGIDYVLKNHTSVEFLFILNTDTYIDKDLVKNFLAEANKDKYKDVGIFSTKMLFWDEKTIHSTGIILSKDLTAYNRGMFETDKGQYDSSPDVFGAIGAGILIRREVLEKIGSNFMDTRFFIYREDDDLNWKSQLLGYRSAYLPGCTVYHKGGGTTIRYSLKKVFFLERNRVFILLKYATLSYFIKSFFYTFLKYMNLSKKQESSVVIETNKKPSIFKAFFTIAKAYLDALWINNIIFYLRFRRDFKHIQRKSFNDLVDKYVIK